jgi:hypothetical protein
LVEHDLAKVGVAGSSPVFRSQKKQILQLSAFFFANLHPGGGTGRHAGLKILFPATGVWVQLPSRVQMITLKAFIILVFGVFTFCQLAVKLAFLLKNWTSHTPTDSNLIYEVFLK